MNLFELVFSYVINMFSIYLDIRILKIFLPGRPCHSAVSFILYLCVCTVNWITFTFINIPNITTCVLLILLFTLSLYQFNSSFFKRLVAICISVGLAVFSESFVWYFDSYTNMLPNNILFCSILPCFILLGLTLFLEHFLHFQKTNKLPAVYNIQIIFIAVSSIALCDILIMNRKVSSNITTLGFTIICCINIFTLFLYDHINTMHQNEIENKTLEQRILMYQNQFQVIRESQNNLRSLRHDLKNHLLLIKSYICDGKNKSALSYIDEITHSSLVASSFINTGNDEMDSVLNYLLSEAKELNCQILTNIQVPKEPFMSSLDLNILLSNLLTNALEALQQTKDRILDIHISYEKNILYVSIYNTFQGTVLPDEQFYRTTKTDRSHHGYGFKNIASIIEKYDGTSSFTVEGNLFKADIILFLKPGQFRE